MTTGWPQSSDSFCPTVRAEDVGRRCPAVNGTIMRTGFVGYA